VLTQPSDLDAALAVVQQIALTGGIWLATAKFAEFPRDFGQVLPYQAKDVKMQWTKKSSSRCVKHMAALTAMEFFKEMHSQGIVLQTCWQSQLEPKRSVSTSTVSFGDI